MMYFYGAMTHYCSWIFNQSQVISVAQTGGRNWTALLESLGDFFTTLANLPSEWLTQGIEYIVNDSGQQQLIPTEAPLELVVQIHLIEHRVAKIPGKIMPS